MKGRGLVLFLLIGCILIFAACSASGGDVPNKNEFPLQDTEYVFDECVYLTGLSSLSIETMTQMKKGELALDLTAATIYYKEVRLYYNLDLKSFDLIDESKFNKMDIIMRFDIYYEQHFSGSTILIDRYEQAYIAYLAYFGTNTKYQFYEIWKIRLND